MSSASSSLRPTAGHHFTAYLNCPQHAWFKYHGDYAKRSPTPPYLKVLQNEGLAHEREVSKRLYPDAVKIPGTLSPDNKTRRTLEAMRAGKPAILQGYLSDKESIIVPDVLELISADQSSDTGHIYRIGEFKKSAVLKTAHILQVQWYAENLRKIQKKVLDEVFFVLKDGKKTLVGLHKTESIYQECRKKLFELRESPTPPGPHLSVLCASCPWRSLCMPRLTEDKHLSLVPHIGRRQASQLKEKGICTWQDLKGQGSDSLRGLGFDIPEIYNLEAAVHSLSVKEPVYKYSINKEILANSIPVVMGIPDLSEQRSRGGRIRPGAVWFEAVGEIVKINIRGRSGEDLPEDLQRLIKSKRPLALFGGTDVGVFEDFLRDNGIKRFPYIIDIFEVVEKLVHCPFPGLELGALLAYIEEEGAIDTITDPARRISALKKVIKWLALERENAS